MPFVDPSFRPTHLSLWGTSSDVPKRGYGGLPTVSTWLRPNAIHAVRAPSREIARREHHLPWALFRGQPSPLDIQQGALGDCWFLSALSVLAQRPDLVHALFPIADKLNKQGAYIVRLCKNGMWRLVLVDDHFPCTAQGALAFTNARSKQLWVPLVEKAFAKLHGSYGAIEAGTCEEGLEALTGHPVVTLDPKKKKESDAWLDIVSNKSAGYLMAAACGVVRGKKNDAATMASLGLQTQHAYSVLEAKAGPSGTPRLLKLRNPWGRSNWRGDWSPRSTRWTSSLRDHFGEFRGTASSGGDYLDGGIFWIDFSDFRRFFVQLHICKVPALKVSGFVKHETRVSGSMTTIATPDCFTAFEIRNGPKRQLSASIALYQPLSFRRGGGTRPTINAVVVELMGLFTDPDVRFVGAATFQSSGSVLVEVDLDPKKRYLVVPIGIVSDGRSSAIRRRDQKDDEGWVLAVHSSHSLELSCVEAGKDRRGGDSLLAKALVAGSLARGTLMMHPYMDFSLYRWDNVIVGFNRSRSQAVRAKVNIVAQNAHVLTGDVTSKSISTAVVVERTFRPMTGGVVAIACPQMFAGAMSWGWQLSMSVGAVGIFGGRSPFERRRDGVFRIVPAGRVSAL